MKNDTGRAFPLLESSPLMAKANKVTVIEALLATLSKPLKADKGAVL